MKRVLIALLLTSLMSPFVVLAGGIVTNANQSAAYIRMPAQDATIGIDGVYYNPAGLAFLNDGFYISVNNQYIVQNRNIKSSFPMNRNSFDGAVTAPIFPSVYLVFKKDKVAWSLGVNPIGGGGGATFDNGLPSFEKKIADIPISLTASGIPTNAYSMETKFEGESLNWGIQFNGSYAINEMIAISLGFRYVIAQNSYKGYLGNIQINPNQPAFNQPGFTVSYDGTNMVSAPVFFTDAATTLTGWATGSTGMSTIISSKITGGEPGTTLLSASTLTATQKATIQSLLGAAGLTPAAISTINIQTARTTLTGAAPVFTAKAAAMTANAAGTQNAEIDAEQNGTGIAPIIGVDLKLSDQLNIGIRYERRVEMNVINKTKLDDVKLYPDGAKTPNDMPSTLSIGVAYKASEKLAFSGGFHYYFDKTANYGKKDRFTGKFISNEQAVDKNFFEAAIGFEYKIGSKFLVSAGYLRTQTGVNEYFQSDLSHSLSTNTFGAGFKYNVNDKIAINVGGMYSIYDKNKKYYALPTTWIEYYNRNAMVAAIGVDIKL